MSSAAPLRTWAEIDLAAVRHNLQAARARVAEGVQVMAVVKADAYGHGVSHIVPALAGLTDWFGVANVREALTVRELAPAVPIFILGPALPDERPLIVEHGFVSSLSSLAEARDFSRLAANTGRRVAAHLVLDTGMGRIGVWEDDALQVAAEIAQLPGLEITGLASHLPSADEDADFTREQLARFHRLTDLLRERHFPQAVRHVDNSAGVLGFAAQAGDLVRPGLMLYGSAPLPEFQRELRPVLTWKTRVTLVREVGAGRGVSYGRTFITPRPMRIATLAAGYADGVRRSLSHHGADVLLGGTRCPLLGRVTMDQIMVDVSHLPAIAEGDEAVLLGRQGTEGILAAELAQKAGTIPWEIFTGLGHRVQRVAVN